MHPLVIHSVVGREALRMVFVLAAVSGTAMVFRSWQIGKLAGLRESLRDFDIDSWPKFLAFGVVLTAAERLSRYVVGP